MYLQIVLTCQAYPVSLNLSPMCFLFLIFFLMRMFCMGTLTVYSQAKLFYINQLHLIDFVKKKARRKANEAFS